MSADPKLERIIRQVRDLIAGHRGNAHVVASNDRETRQVVAAELLAALARSDAEEQSRARLLFVDHGYLDETIRDLRGANSPEQRAAAAHTLGIVGSRRSTAHLIAALFDDSLEVQRAAASALAQIGDPAVAEGPLKALLVSDDQEILPAHQAEEEQGPAKQSLMPIDSDVADMPPTIVADLHSADPGERVEALRELARSGATGAFRLIANSFDDVSLDVRRAAAQALYELEPHRSAESFRRAIEEGSPERGRNIGGALVASGLATQAIEELGRDNREDTYSALSLLFVMARTGEIQPLIMAIEEHQDLEVRRAAIKLLTLNGQSEVAEAAVRRRLMLRPK